MQKYGVYLSVQQRAAGQAGRARGMNKWTFIGISTRRREKPKRQAAVECQRHNAFTELQCDVM